MSPFAIEAFEKPAVVRQRFISSWRCRVGIPSNGSGRIPRPRADWQVLLNCRPVRDCLETLRNSEDGTSPLRAIKLAIQALKANWFWLKWLVALSFLAYLFYAYRVQLANLLAQRPDWTQFSLAVLVVAASITLTFYRWYLLVWAQDFPFTVKDALRLSFIGYACNFIGPGAAGGDLIKAGLIATEQTSRKGIAAATVLLDRILGVLALFMVGAFSMFFNRPRCSRTRS